MKNHISKKASLDLMFYQNYISELYENINKERSIAEIYGYLVRTSGNLCKAIISKNSEPKHYLRPISWLFTFSSKIGLNFQEALLKRYPMICPYCLKMTCVCFKTGKKPPDYIPAYKMGEEMDDKHRMASDDKKIKNFDWTIRNISNIYPNNEVVWYYAGPWHHVAKIYEEIAEVHEAFSSYSKGERPIRVVGDELADVFSWIISMWKIEKKDSSFDDMFLDYYLCGCPVCQKNPCTCKKYNSRPAGLVDIGKLVEIKNKLDELYQIIPISQDEIKSLVKSFDKAVETYNEPTARLSVSQTADKLNKIKAKLSNVDEIGQKSFSIISTIFNIIEKFT